MEPKWLALLGVLSLGVVPANGQIICSGMSDSDRGRSGYSCGIPYISTFSQTQGWTVYYFHSVHSGSELVWETVGTPEISGNGVCGAGPIYGGDCYPTFRSTINMQDGEHVWIGYATNRHFIYQFCVFESEIQTLPLKRPVRNCCDGE
jgi:hypothetical protein